MSTLVLKLSSNKNRVFFKETFRFSTDGKKFCLHWRYLYTLKLFVDICHSTNSKHTKIANLISGWRGHNNIPVRNPITVIIIEIIINLLEDGSYAKNLTSDDDNNNIYNINYNDHRECSD